ncbi:AAA family ATPase [Dolichospermum sp. ST_con]|nr:AAA family ATPase [Dolichospermum sp. ST_con]MDD1420084.1 AAA family ATPase [Dolichospermum sp. ST_sed1]MDD1426091.1 AAA family ATPase [Dolichospermum sp. ST_sed9]MDD1430314.1 AAA family ATPase [Dolichospermum sp. ST_sed6]MDD1437958.1 AAA family ATPase [Dolichospermum sp. ST_sed10]MDD1441876.1 AAA family ATPase [Dolichospermum sp. ST_sed3]MDD1447618.1 AAA family ATPase [Dolichospermum sp. ST_sed8]MDD1455944.1 AAA family ATPase [Dolichospermum sp. ST_sed7]MDD1461324.1 AAA family ATPase [D
MTLKLISAKIKNFKSLGDVDLNFRDLTILVGANASGKSNSLEALRFLSKLLKEQELPSLNYMDSILRVGEKQIFYELTIEDDENNRAEYSIALSLSEDNFLINKEYLLVNGIEVINIINGEGRVKDENNENSQPYQSSEGDGLALTDAGKYGHKPFTKKLASYIRDWKLYDVDPGIIRTFNKINKINKRSKRNTIRKPVAGDEIMPSLDTHAIEAEEVLQYWARYDKNKFDEVSQELYNCLNIKLQLVEDVEALIQVIEEDGKKIALSNMSDGTLRLIAYFIMLYQSDVPTLISIEEPERNFHPGILQDIADMIKRLSKRTQVIFTTHSSQLLDCFSPEEISSDICQ